MFIGRYNLGQRVPITFLTRNASRVASTPDASPVLRIYTAAGSLLAAKVAPPLDKAHVTGLFDYSLVLNSSYATGIYDVHISWLISSSPFQTMRRFEVLAGGDSDGALISQHHYERPHAEFLVQRADSDQRILTRNPGV